MTEYHVILPDERFSILEWRAEDLPAISVVNSALIDFEPKAVFAWHLTIMVEFAELVENGMPSTAEREVVDQFGLILDKAIKAEGNALFLARVTWNGGREILYRVYDPELANAVLRGIIDREDYSRPFEYRMAADEPWGEAESFFLAIRDAPKGGTSLRGDVRA